MCIPNFNFLYFFIFLFTKSYSFLSFIIGIILFLLKIDNSLFSKPFNTYTLANDFLFLISSASSVVATKKCLHLFL